MILLEFPKESEVSRPSEFDQDRKTEHNSLVLIHVSLSMLWTLTGWVGSGDTQQAYIYI